MKLKLLVIQRVITPYRYQLLSELQPYYNITIISSFGEKKGSLKLASIPVNSGINIITLKSLKIRYSGESRSTSLFFYPQVVFYINKHDLLLIEGTTNFLNNLFILPISRLLRKKVIWWDAGYSLPKRSTKRKFIDAVVKPLVMLTQYQIAYSSSAKKYMEDYMGANNCSTLINTISTSYFISKKDFILDSVRNYKPTKNVIKLLYVGAIEERKKIKELIDVVSELNDETSSHYSLTIIGGGNYLNKIKAYISANKSIISTGPIYDLDELSYHYFNADIFVMPGDGGLAIVQALLFGLPAICTIADGTETDYLDQKYIFNDLTEIKSYLRNFDYPDKLSIVEQSERLHSSSWVKGFLNMVKE